MSLVVVFEMVASAARLAAAVVGILATTIEGLIGSLFKIARLVTSRDGFSRKR